jgi:anti-sigma28 factor (negative regulator of flagellin synthesis)
MSPPRSRSPIKRVSIARRARQSARRARLEWEALALRLGFGDVNGLSTGALRQRKVAQVLDSLACGAYRVDAEALAARLIARLRKQARSPQV